MEGFAFFGFLAPIIGAIAGGGLAGTLATAAIGIGGQLIAAKKQKKAAQAEQAAIAAAEAKSQGAFRNQLRSGAGGRGSGDFADKLGSAGSFNPQLKSLTGQ